MKTSAAVLFPKKSSRIWYSRASTRLAVGRAPETPQVIDDVSFADDLSEIYVNVPFGP